MRHKFGTSLPFVRPFLALIAGIVIAEFTSFATPALVVIILLLLSLALHLIKKGRQRLVVFRSIMILFTVAASGSYLNSKDPYVFNRAEEGFIRGRFIAGDRVRCSDYSCRTTGHFIIADSIDTTQYQATFIIARSDSVDPIPGAVYAFTGSLSHFKPPVNPYEFDRLKYENERQLSGEVKVDSIKLVSTSPLDARSKGKHHLDNVLNEIENPDVKTVCFALLSGDKTELNPEVRNHFARCGIMHLLAVSGLHVGLIAWLPLMLLRYSYRKFMRLMACSITLLIVWVFAWFTGFSASVIRAAAMVSLIAVGMTFGKRVSSINSLCAVGIFMLVSEPRLLFHPGFLLSFSAVAAIVSWTPILTDLYPGGSRLSHYFSQSSAVAITAQAGTSPIGVYYFKQLPLLFLPANIVAVPLATLMLYVLLLGVILSSAGVSVPWLFELLNLMGKLLLAFAEFISSLKFAAWEQLNISLHEALLWSVFTIIFFYILAQKSPRNFWVLLLPGLAILMCLHQRLDHRVEVTVFSGYRDPVIGLNGRMESVLILPSTETFLYRASAWQREKKAHTLVLDHDTCFVHGGIEIQKTNSGLFIGKVLIGDVEKLQKVRPQDNRLVLKNGHWDLAVVCEGIKNVEWDLSQSACQFRINSTGTIEEVYGQHRPPIRLSHR